MEVLMGKWLDLAAKLEEEGGASANSAINAVSAPKAASSPPIGTIGTNGTASLPPAIRMGLNSLRLNRPPRITNPEVWSVIVADAAGIASEGWARMALALGWHPLDLFGCSADGDFEGLAVWLAGRRLVLIDEQSAIVAEGGRRSVFNRREHDGAVHLWELGTKHAA
jgi:hypothetical protein